MTVLPDQKMILVPDITIAKHKPGWPPIIELEDSLKDKIAYCRDLLIR
jgi:hypothetical protein